MSIRTSRASGVAGVTVDEATCTGCGACVRVCFGKPLELEGGRVTVDQSRVFGCIGCGACVAVCPTGAISVEGRDLTPTDVFALPPRDARAGYPGLLALLESRRSTRTFTADEIAPELVDAILKAASAAPMGIPPSDVGVLVLEGRERVAAFAKDSLGWMVKARRWLGPTLPLMRPFMRRTDYELTRDFVLPAVDYYRDYAEKGVDWFFYDAPLAMMFYGCGACDPADPYIAATYSVIAAESLGLGSCMLGFAAYPATYSKAIRKRWGLPDRIQPGIMVIFGHPAIAKRHGVRRRFARIDRPAAGGVPVSS
ncbi:MAG: 4Fe-4S binding protein [Coriobacteriia bacterium]|nr:4Fe-4S binding protein [Coriobacteriia bacterium]